MKNPILEKTNELLKEQLETIEAHFKADCIYINGPISSELVEITREVVERLVEDTTRNTTAYILLTTGGGDAISVERLANIFRHNYSEVNFIVPDHAYSAGTILCMSGDNIWMDYNSVLGPIDPQVQNKEGRYVPVLGYLDKIEDLIKKAQTNSLSQAEFLILKDFDLAELSQYEQATELTTDLLEQWLVKYKFKNWKTHSSTGKRVTEKDKKERAKRIAKDLANYSKWKSHGRPLNIDVIRNLKLKVEDFGENKEQQRMILNFHYMCENFMRLQEVDGFVFSRRNT